LRGFEKFEPENFLPFLSLRKNFFDKESRNFLKTESFAHLLKGKNMESKKLGKMDKSQTIPNPEINFQSLSFLIKLYKN